jgi:hypothetical protein
LLEKFNRMGRPSPEKPKTRMLGIRCTEETLHRFRFAFRESGFTDYEEFLNFLLDAEGWPDPRGTSASEAPTASERPARALDRS